MRRMRKEDHKPTYAAFYAAFNAADDLHRLDVSNEFFEHYLEVGLPPQEFFYAKVSTTAP